MFEFLIFLIAFSDQSHWILKERLGFVPLLYMKEENFSSTNFGFSFGLTYRSSFPWLVEGAEALSPGIFPQYVEINFPFKKTDTNFLPFYRKIYFWGLKDVSYLDDQATGRITDTILWKEESNLYIYGATIKQLLKQKTGVLLSLFQLRGKINEQLKKYAAQKLAYAITSLSGWGIKGVFFTTIFRDIEVKLKGSFLSKVSGIKTPGGDTIILSSSPEFPPVIFYLPDTIENEMPYQIGIEIQKKFKRISGFMAIYYEGWEKVSTDFRADFRNVFALSTGASYQTSPKILASLYLTYLWDYWQSERVMEEEGLILTAGLMLEISKRISTCFNASGQKPYQVYGLQDPGIRYELGLDITINLKN